MSRTMIMSLLIMRLIIVVIVVVVVFACFEHRFRCRKSSVECFWFQIKSVSRVVRVKRTEQCHVSTNTAALCLSLISRLLGSQLCSCDHSCTLSSSVLCSLLSSFCLSTCLLNGGSAGETRSETGADGRREDIDGCSDD